MRHPAHALVRWLQPTFISIEAKQEAAGKGLQAQNLRYIQTRCHWKVHPGFVRWIISQIEADTRLQETVQREAFLKEECQRIQGMAEGGSLTPEDENLLQRWLAELETLNEAYWEHERKNEIQGGIFIPGFGVTAPDKEVAAAGRVGAARDPEAQPDLNVLDIALRHVAVASELVGSKYHRTRRLMRSAKSPFIPYGSLDILMIRCCWPMSGGI